MQRNFTHYWSNRTWIQQQYYNSDYLDHVAGNLFSKRGIKQGDAIYTVTVIKGKLFLCGKLIVGKLCEVFEAAAHFEYEVEDLWEAKEHIIASAATSMNFHLAVPWEITLKLRFRSGKALKSLLFSSHNYLDSQTLRGVRELDAESASELDKLLPPLSEKISFYKQSHQYNKEIFPDEVPSDLTYYEGTTKQVKVNRYERNTQARQECINHHGLNCSVCGFNFKDFYGEIGDGYIHIHHLKPLSEIGEEYKLNAIQDLRPVCPNCHAMLHRIKPVCTIETLQQLLKRNNNK